MCLSRAQQTKSKQWNYGIGNRTLQRLFFKPFNAQLHLSSLRLQVVLLEFERLTKSAVSLFSLFHLRPHLSLEGFQTGMLIQANMSLRVSERGWLRKRSRCVFLNRISLLKQTGGDGSAYVSGAQLFYSL